MAHLAIQDIEAFNPVGRIEKPIVAGDTTFQVRGAPEGLASGDIVTVDLFGTSEERTVSSIENRTITVSSAFSSAHEAGVIWLRGDIMQTETISDVGAWTDYSASSLIVGWSSYTTKQIFYRTLGSLVFVAFNIAGTSNSTLVSFTTPSSKHSSPNNIEFMLGLTTDNGTPLTTPGRCVMTNNSVVCHPDAAIGLWTASGSKQVTGQFWYEAA